MLVMKKSKECNRLHRVGRARISDWLENSILMVVYEKKIFICAFDTKFLPNFKKNL